MGEARTEYCPESAWWCRRCELIGSAYDLYDTDETVPVSLITAPVFNAAGDAQWELQIAPFHQGLPATERDRMIAEIKATARELV
ncbi:MAG: hypothetical protein JWR37_2479 [Mycobacterium sp.]|jgi:hypothetical protein|nr:hypothetical protein [Mycobacterium sp.]